MDMRMISIYKVAINVNRVCCIYIMLKDDHIRCILLGECYAFWGERDRVCWLSESCLRRSSVSCAVSGANLRCRLSESYLRRSSLSCAVSADIEG